VSANSLWPPYIKLHLTLNSGNSICERFRKRKLQHTVNAIACCVNLRMAGLLHVSRSERESSVFCRNKSVSNKSTNSSCLDFEIEEIKVSMNRSAVGRE